MKIAGVIVTYNRKELLLKNLLMQEKQIRKLDYVFIVDNGCSDGTKDFIDNYKLSINYKFISLSENVGFSEACKIGIVEAYNSSFDWIYMMDDDGRPMNDETIFLLEKYINENKISFSDSWIINSIVLQEDNLLTFRTNNTLKYSDLLKQYNDFILGNTYLWNGSLISKSVFTNVGFPNEIFAFKGEDVEFKQRCKKNNVKMVTLLKSLYYHPGFQDIEIRFLFKKMFFNKESKWKYYYSIRNRTYMLLQEKKRLKAFLVYLKFIYCIKKIFNKDSKSYCEFVKIGYKDGLKSKMGLNKDIMQRGK